MNRAKIPVAWWRSRKGLRSGTLNVPGIVALLWAKPVPLLPIVADFYVFSIAKICVLVIADNNLAFHYPFSKPNKLIVFRNTFIAHYKIVKTITTMIALFIISLTLFNNIYHY
jgi:hypothetical protein